MLMCRRYLIKIFPVKIIVLIKIMIHIMNKVIHFKIIILIILHGLKILGKIDKNIWVLSEKLKMLIVLVILSRKIHQMNFNFKK